MQIREIISDYSNISGILISNGWSLGQCPADETVEEKDEQNKIIGLALRRSLHATCSKETILIGRNGLVSDDLKLLAEWFYEEPTWLDWALQKIGLNYKISELLKVPCK